MSPSLFFFFVYLLFLSFCCFSVELMTRKPVLFSATDLKQTASQRITRPSSGPGQ
ncbi:hypothetical protein AB205_0204390 [Aquarana catesbeiana]|uniref:Uncharacterized protein n=1 Tax=Aquarana catesbeiana TaxID=8400 RepID=A0A2G9SGA5_AQUCT|nr:hypothetical protein AB205_0204390 [Aquarana catesbeiana]